MKKLNEISDGVVSMFGGGKRKLVRGAHER